MTNILAQNPFATNINRKIRYAIVGLDSFAQVDAWVHLSFATSNYT